MSESLLTEIDKLLLSSGVEDSLLHEFVDPDDHKPKIVAVVPGSRAGTTVVGKLNLVWQIQKKSIQSDGGVFF